MNLHAGGIKTAHYISVPENPTLKSQLLIESVEYSSIMNQSPLEGTSPPKLIEEDEVISQDAAHHQVVKALKLDTRRASNYVSYFITH